MKLRNRQELQFVAELLTEIDVKRADRRDPFGEYLIRTDVNTECKIHENREFMGRIDTANIESGIGLRVTRLLRFSEDIRIRPVLIRHFGENVVRCAVDNAVNRQNAIRG